MLSLRIFPASAFFFGLQPLTFLFYTVLVDGIFAPTVFFWNYVFVMKKKILLSDVEQELMTDMVWCFQNIRHIYIYIYIYKMLRMRIIIGRKSSNSYTRNSYGKMCGKEAVVVAFEQGIMSRKEIRQFLYINIIRKTLERKNHNFTFFYFYTIIKKCHFLINTIKIREKRH